MCTLPRVIMREFVIFVTIAFALVTRVESKVPFQVSIQLKNSQTPESDANQYHLCNGIIIHEMYILTTANCLYFPIMNTDLSIQLMATDITVAAGLRNSSNTTLYRNVVSIIPHHKFNKTTYDNDIAVLKLDSSLPLANNTDVQWLDVTTSSDTHGSNDSCFATIFNSTQKNEGLYSISKRPANLQHSICANTNDTALIRKMDLCLEYLISDGAHCNISVADLKFSKERGTAYICNNKLVGLLADINAPKNVEKCFLSHKTTAFYVNVSMHLDWLLDITELKQFDANKTDPYSTVAPRWTDSTESPPINPSSTSKPNSAAIIFCNFIFSLTLFIIVFIF